MTGLLRVEVPQLISGHQTFVHGELCQTQCSLTKQLLKLPLTNFIRQVVILVADPLFLGHQVKQVVRLALSTRSMLLLMFLLLLLAHLLLLMFNSIISFLRGYP